MARGSCRPPCARTAFLARIGGAFNGAFDGAFRTPTATVAGLNAERRTARALAAPVRLRLARMERWLAARAAADPQAQAAAGLCLWVLEHLEAGDG